MELSPDGVSFSLHPLVRDWIQHRLSEEEYNHYAYEAVEALGSTASRVSLGGKTPPARRRIIANMDACICSVQPVLSLDRHPKCDNFLASLGCIAHCYVELGRYAAGRDLYKTILDLRLSQPRPSDHLSHTFITMNLAIASTHLGHYDQAKKFYKSVLQERENRLGRDHEGTQRALHGLATTEMYLEHYEQSSNMFESLLRAQCAQLPERRTGFFRTVSQLASVYRFTKKFGLAKTCCEMVVMESVKLLGPHHLTTLAELEGLAIVYRNMDRVAEAIMLYTHVLSRYEATLGWEHPHTLRLATNYGIALMHQTKHEEGIRLLETAADGLESLLGASHPDTVWSRHHIADAKLIRDQRYNQELFHYGRQSAVRWSHQEAQRIAAGKRRRIDNQDSRDGDQRADGEPSKPSGATTPKDVALRGAQGKPEPPANPKPGWSELNAVFDTSGALDIQAAALCKETFWSRKGRREGGKETAIAEILRKATQYSYADLLDTLEQHHGLGPNEADKRGFTQLHHATVAGDLDGLHTLPARENIEADSNTASYGRTPLMLACWRGHQAVVASLLAHRPQVDVNARNSGQDSVLLQAVDRHSGSCPSKHDAHTFRIVELLLATGKVDVNYTKPDRGYSFERRTAFEAAAERGGHVMRPGAAVTQRCCGL